MVKQESSETIVATGMRIDGELKSSGNISIDGLVSGKIQTSHGLNIGPNAQIDADMVAEHAVIAGTVKGNVTVKTSLVITETGKLIGNVNCQSLGISEGAYFSGACKMAEPKPQEIKN